MRLRARSLTPAFTFYSEQNPLLQSLWPLSSKLTISRQIDPSLSPIPDVTAVGKNGTLFAQLWYDGESRSALHARTTARDR